MIDQKMLYKDISELERNTELWSNDPAPTVPIYDLTSAANIPLIPNTIGFGVSVYSGSPTDHLVVDICNDNSGQPGSVIMTSAPNDPILVVPTPFHFSSAIALIPGVTYWAVMRRTGALNNSNFYQLHLGNGGSPPLLNEYGWYDGSVWNVSPGSGALWGYLTYDGTTNVWQTFDNGVSGPFGLSLSGYAQKVATAWVA